jgi:GR25 family glycosyltransferase involved in LPS biosynthesis
MNLDDASSSLRRLGFRAQRGVARLFPGGRIRAFGTGPDAISAIVVVNLDRQPRRWRWVLRELRRFRTRDGASLVSIARRLSAVDARDGRAVAATADVDAVYRMGDQLYVQPDARLEACFDREEPIRMTRQEVAVARSHVEAWKSIATGSEDYVLVLEDDVWFTRGAAGAIDRGWRAALQRRSDSGWPRMLYLSYADAGGSAARLDVCDNLFRPARGLWFLSGYVLSRDGAAALLRAMPVVGPVDMWVNYRFAELGALALASPVILQRPDCSSDNSYSVLPYLARAGIVDAGSGGMRPTPPGQARVLAFSAQGGHESLAMALSMLGLRVRAFDGDEAGISAQALSELLDTFDALVDAPLAPDALSAARKRPGAIFLREPNAAHRYGADTGFQAQPLETLSPPPPEGRSWEPLCTRLGLPEPIQPYPLGAPRGMRLFRDDRSNPARQISASGRRKRLPLDDSPWVLPSGDWQPRPPTSHARPPAGRCLVYEPLTKASSPFRGMVETFPGNLASFTSDALCYDAQGAHLIVSKARTGIRAYESGAFASTRSFAHGQFQVELRAACGSGLVTGFFLHRDAPRQEIDIEIPGKDPRCMLVNVYFNPGDDGAALGFCYRGAPCRVDLGFDATMDFHLYAIDWRPGRIIWSVDDRIVHERVSWDPTPIPHLPMRLHANLWAPRSEELAGGIEDTVLPANAIFRNISVSA